MLFDLFKKKVIKHFDKDESFKVLIIRLGAIGDVVHTTNLIHSIKIAYPNSEIHYFTSTTIKPLLLNDKSLSKVWDTNPDELKLKSQEIGKIIEDFKQEKYDLIFNLQPSAKTRYIAKKSLCENVVNYKKTFKMHAVVNFWDTAKQVLPELELQKKLELFLDESVCKSVEEKISTYKRPFVVLNAGGVYARRQGRTYPVEKWINLGNLIQETYDGTIFVTGIKVDEPLISELLKIKNSVSFIGQLSLEENSALIKQSDLLISGDSGPLHIATALGVKTVGLYGSMPVDRTGQFGDGNISIVSDFKCVPCNRRRCKYLRFKKELFSPCMYNISDEKVFSCVKKLLPIEK